ncbi:MAG TPA: alpha/beta hydrolase [Anaeromyxobacteraceae bacterium]|nr:alpha/beta hydrolase [Anaeromyxobacteraceae bacterium]
MMLAADLAPVLILPGLFDSGPEHWQTRWMMGRPGFRRVEQKDWVAPRCADWIATLDRAVEEAGHGALLVAHGAGCALVAHWASNHRRNVRGTMLVAPSDVEAPSYPSGATGFSPMPLMPLPFASTVVASSNDQYVSLERARFFANSWGSRFVNFGPAGHINSASGLGAWPEGVELLEELANR